MSETTEYEYCPLIVRDYLLTKLPTSVRVSTEVPSNWQTATVQSLVTIEQVPASGADNLVLSTRRLIIQCWNSKELTAGRLAETVRSLMFDVGRVTRVRWLRKVNVIGEPGRFDDPDTAMPRFQMTVDVLMRAKTGKAS